MEQILAKRYQLIHKIRRGGTSTPWKALDLRTQKPVVLKFPHPKLHFAQEKIEREARAYQTLGRVSGLVNFVGYEENEGHELGPFLALEYLPGMTLAEHLLKQERLSEPQTIAVGRAACKIMERIQTNNPGFVHRDLSLNNIFLLGGTKEIRLIDLGLALVPNESGEGYQPHEMGRVGTPSTWAPELSTSCAGDTRSDIYSLGRVLYLMASGQETPGQQLTGIAPKAAGRVSEGLSDIIVRCLKTTPNTRYQSIRELDQALARLQFKRAAVRWCGVLILAGLAYSIAEPYLPCGTEPIQKALPPSLVLTEAPPTTMSALPPSTKPTPPPDHSIPIAEVPQPPVKQTKPRLTAKPIIQAPPTETVKEIVTETPTETAPKPLTEEEEIDAITRKRALKYATKPIPIEIPQFIDIIVK